MVGLVLAEHAIHGWASNPFLQDFRKAFILCSVCIEQNPLMSTPHLSPHSILETCLYARDLEKAHQFYQGVMGLEPASSEEGRHVFFRVGNGMFLVFNPEETKKTPFPQGENSGMDIPPHGAQGAGHVAFQVSAESIPQWKAQFACHAVPVEREIHWPHGGCSLFVRDPADNSVEVATSGIWEWIDS